MKNDKTGAKHKKNDRRETDAEFRRRAERFAPSIATFTILDEDGKIIFDGNKETLKALDFGKQKEKAANHWKNMKHKRHLKQLCEDFGELLGSRLVTFKKVTTLENVTGVYLICAEKEIIYAGSTNRFNVRFGTDLLHKSTHTLHRKLLEEGKTTEQIKYFLNNNCRYKIKKCKDKLEAEALEHLVIWIIKPKYNKYIYQSDRMT